MKRYEVEPYAYELQTSIEDWHWWFVARRKIISTLLAKYPDPRLIGQYRALDIGCGTGKNLETFKSLGWVVGIDESNQALSYCLKRGLSRIVQGSALALPFSSESFNLITMLDILEHLEDDQKALRECYNALKPKGILFLTVPAFPSLWGLQDEIGHHKRRYRKKELIEKIEKAGFEIIRLTYFNSFLFPAIFIGRLLVKAIPHQFKSENEFTAPGLNWFLKKTFSSEAYLLQRFNFPFGVSLAVIGNRGRCKLTN